MNVLPEEDPGHVGGTCFSWEGVLGSGRRLHPLMVHHPVVEDPWGHSGWRVPGESSWAGPTRERINLLALGTTWVPTG